MNTFSLPWEKGCFECKGDPPNLRVGQRAQKFSALMLQSFNVQCSIHHLVMAQYLVHLQAKAQNRFILEPHHLKVVHISLNYSLSHPLVMARMSLNFD